MAELSAPHPPDVRPLGLLRKGERAVVAAIVDTQQGDLPPGELEGRFLEMGFIEGASVELVHEGPIGRDPIAVKVRESVIALRRREANAILVQFSQVP